MPVYPRGADSPALNAFAITPGTAEFAEPTRFIYVGGTGKIIVVTVNDDEVIFQNAQVGTVLPVRAKQVLALSESFGSPTETTTATNLLGLY